MHLRELAHRKGHEVVISEQPRPGEPGPTYVDIVTLNPALHQDEALSGKPVHITLVQHLSIVDAMERLSTLPDAETPYDPNAPLPK